MANTIEVFFTPIDKVSNEVWAGVAQRKTLEKWQQDKKRGYDLPISPAATQITSVNLAVWNTSDTVEVTDINGNAVLDSENRPLLVLKEIKNSQNPLNEWDRCIHDAIVSLVVDGCKDFTPVDILRILYGIPNDTSFIPTKDQILRVNESVWKIANTKIKLNFKDEAIGMSRKQYMFKKSKKFMTGEFEINEDLLTLSDVRIKGKDGVYAIGYHYHGDLNDWDELPALYRYASPKKQVARIEMASGNNNIFDTRINNKQMLRKDDSVITLEHYLHRKLNAMHSKNVSNVLHIETILKDLNYISSSIDELDKFKRNRFYQKIESVLNIWKSKNYISDWKWEKANRKTSEGFDNRPLRKGKLVIDFSTAKEHEV